MYFHCTFVIKAAVDAFNNENSFIMKKSFLILTVAMTALTSIACSDIDTTNDEDVTKVKERKDIVLSKSHREMVPMSNTFAFDFFTAVNKAEFNNDNAYGNIMVSPLSMQSLLSMMTPGASDDLAADMIKGIGFEGYSVEDLASYYKELIPALLNVDSSVSLWNANAIWVRDPLKIDKNYLSIVKDKYDATAATLPKNGQEAADIINDWCSKNTNKMIDHIFDDVPAEYVMVLANALYFKGIWSEEYKFETSLTRNDTFTNADGSSNNCKIMHKTFEGTAYFDGELASVSIPFGNGAFSMRFIMPADKDDNINVTLASLNSAKWNELTGNGEYVKRYGEIIMSLPKFESEYEASSDILKTAFNSIGLGGIFTGCFDSMANEVLKLGEIGQKTKIKVNETGAEAAAVSHGEMKCTSVGPSDGVFHFEATRPFIYVISECSTGAILFEGVVKQL